MGKAARQESGTEFKDADVAKSLLSMIANTIAQIACLNARLYGLNKILFGGFFSRSQPGTMAAITFAVKYWGQGKLQALFLRHEGYLGAIGAFLSNSPVDVFQIGHGKNLLEKQSFDEHFTRATPKKEGLLIGSLELEHRVRGVAPFPLLADLDAYEADTENLCQDVKAREYWIACLKRAQDKVVKLAIASSEGTAAVQRAEAFGRTYLEHLAILEQDPSAYGKLSVRMMLDVRQQCLREFNFVDPYVKIKQQENSVALTSLAALVTKLDQLEWAERQRTLVEGLLAGNAFDWGAQVKPLFELAVICQLACLSLGLYSTVALLIVCNLFSLSLTR
eukprot:m.127229 g.127229  ORF g.127229 m.127229 type:complete len:335 (-) comp16699_c0_seq3:931-1935(-)